MVDALKGLSSGKHTNAGQKFSHSMKHEDGVQKTVDIILSEVDNKTETHLHKEVSSKTDSVSS